MKRMFKAVLVLLVLGTIGTGIATEYMDSNLVRPMPPSNFEIDGDHTHTDGSKPHG